MKRMSSLALFVMLFALAGCGLGTEVGNGFKSDEGESDKKNKSAAENADESGGDPGTTDAANKGEPPAEDGQMNEGVDSESSVDPGDSIKDGADTPPETPEGFDFNPAFLVASCASPFSEDYGQNYILSTADSGEGVRNQMTAKRDGAQGAWTLADSTAKTLFTVEKNPGGGAVAVSTKDSSEKNVSYFTCTAVSTKTNVDVEDLAFKVTKRSVYIGDSKIKSKVTWYFKPAAGPTRAELVRIEIDDVDGENDAVRLDVSPDSVP